MAKISGDATLSDLARVAISKYLNQGISYEKEVLADADPEDLHQMRVGLRRLRTALQVFEPAVNLPKAGREPRVAAVARQLGELRDLDVISETLRKHYGPDLPDTEQQSLARVLSQLFKQRQQVFKRVKKLLKGKKYGQMKQSLQEWTQHPSLTTFGQMPAALIIPDLVGPLVSRLWLHPGFLVGATVSQGGFTADPDLKIDAVDRLMADQGALLHSLRKQVKRVRYQLKLVSHLYEGALDDDLARFSDIQETLGHLQDSMVLEEFVAKAIPDGKTQMPTLFALLADSRHRAWQQWQVQQNYYLEGAHRQALRLAILHIAALEPKSAPKST